MAYAERDPRIGTGLIASILLHGGLIAAFVLFRGQAPPPTPPMFKVQLFAAPPGERAIGVVNPPVEAPPAAATPPPAPVKTAPKPVPAPVKAKPKPAPPRATPSAAPPATAPAKPVEAPKAGGGAEGGRGADVANIDTPGIEFPYPYYTNNIARQIILRFSKRTSRSPLKADVRFMIRRDGSVDPASIRIATGSGNFLFDQEALAAVEGAANAKAFGPLPAGFREDILPVLFRFEPSAIR